MKQPRCWDAIRSFAALRAPGPWARILLLCAAAGAAAAPGGSKGGGAGQGSPTLEFAADRPSYEVGQTATLRWNSTNTRFCSASGDWNGKLPSDGSYRTAPLDGRKAYSLKCQAPGGGVSDTLVLQVSEPAPEPAAATSTGAEPVAPAVTLTPSQTPISSGGTVTLSWSTDGASACTASGGWSGSRATSGAETVGPLYGSTAFTLSCEGNGISAMETVRVDVLGQVTVQWQPPAENVDGSALDDLAGFDLYYGTTSGAYDGIVHIADPRTTSHTLTIPSGTYFMAMTATDRDGNESGFSNEIQRAVP